MKIGVVTTFSDSGYYEYGKSFIDSCQRLLSKNITLYVYVDNIELEQTENVIVRKLEESIPALTEFKNRNNHRVPEKFLYDAVRFSHKSYCIYHASQNSTVDKLFWLDSDTELFNNITPEYLDQFLPDEYFTSYIGRSDYSETGFLGFNLKHPYSETFFDLFKNYYDSDEIYSLKGQLDCHVFDVVRERLEKENKIKGYNLSLLIPNIGKHHFNNIFRGYLLHFKGQRKGKREKLISKLHSKATY